MARALTLFLKQPCFRRAPEPAPGKYLTPQESFALKAYMRQATLAERATTPAIPSAAIGGAAK